MSPPMNRPRPTRCPVNDVVIMPASFPKTRALLEEPGFRIQTVELSELQKAEAGVTCSSVIFQETNPIAKE